MTPPAAERVWPLGPRTWAYALAIVLALAIADDLLRMPVQVFDALEEILAAYRSPSVWASFWGATFNAAYLRPLRIAQIKVLFDLAHGHYWLVYRGFHALLLIAGLLLFTRALRVRTRADLFAAAFALTALTGLHTFRTLVQEAFPINHFLEIAVFALATLNVAQSRGGAKADAAGLALLAAAALTLESGLLVWVVAVAAWACGLRGISTRGIALMTALVAGYFYLRFVSLSVGVPALTERSSGYLFGVLEPAELQARFGDRLWWFRLYNVVASGLSVLFSEPQSGVLVITRSWAEGHVPVRYVTALVSSVGTTALIAVSAVGWAARRRDGDAADALLGVFVAVLGASAAMSYAYTKDDIMSTAGIFYALGAYAAVRRLAGRLDVMPRLASAMCIVALLVVGTAWSVRSLGIHHIAQSSAFKTRNDWAFQPGAWKREGRWPARADEQNLLQRLRGEALSMPAPNPKFEAAWANEVWGD